jgi:hypothetical protein
MPRRHRGRSLAHGLLELAILLFGETEVRARTDAPARRAVSCRINPAYLGNESHPLAPGEGAEAFGEGGEGTVVDDYLAGFWGRCFPS